MPRKKPEPVPDDILAMSLEELKTAHDAQSSPEAQDEFDVLVKARDDAQAALSARNKRNFQITSRYSELLAKKLKDEAA